MAVTLAVTESASLVMELWPSVRSAQYAATCNGQACSVALEPKTDPKRYAVARLR
jgi:hypothetical protein